jgi:glycosyltransferase involved in cell wall biosynthesis
MRIVHFISHYPYPDQATNPHLTEHYVCSGAEAAAHNLIHEQAQAGHSVAIVTSSVSRADVREIREGYTVYRYGSWFKLSETLFSPGMFFRPLRDIGKPDIVHIHHTTPPGGMAGMVCNIVWRRPLVVMHHGFEKPDSYGTLLRRIAVFLSAKYYVDILFRAAAQIIYISPAFFHTSRFLKKYQFKIVLIRYGYYPSEYHTDIPSDCARRELGLLPDKRYGLFVGTLIPPKGLGVILDALPRVVMCQPDFVLLVLGRGPMEEDFRRQAKELGVSESVRFVGFVGESARKLLYYRASDVLLIPSSLSEMYCFVLYEGAASGCCLVTSDLDVFKMVISDHVNGIITQAGNPREMEQAVLEIMQDRDLQTRLGRAAKAQIVPLTWTEVSERTLQMYASLLTGKPPLDRSQL